MMSRKIGKSAIYAASIMTAGVLAFGQPIVALAATGTVTSSNVKVRSEASTSSQQVSSLDSGDKVDIIDETTDSQGYVWYRIYVNGNEYGYIRSDLVSKSGETKSTDAGTASASLPETQVTAVAEQAATVSVESANVRSGAGTGYTTVGTVKNGDGVTVTGEAQGTDSKKWYQIKFGESGRAGFVRADLLTMGAPAAEAPADDPQGESGEMAPAEGEQPVEGEAVEGQPAEGEQPAEQPAANPVDVGNGEFSLAYKDDGTGNQVWYLYDNVESTQVKLGDLLDYAKAGQQANALQEQVGKLKGALIGMAVVIAILVLGILLLVYKLRDAMYYEDEEEEAAPQKKNKYDDLPKQKPAKRFFDKDENDEPKSLGRTVADSKRTTSPRRNAPMGSAASLLQDDKPARRPITPERPERSERVSRAERPERVAPSRERNDAPRQVTPQAPTGRKSRNFLLDDEDFEFEFLDLDDEDRN
ncbi:SH3 domain-containing protein [Butyrivibrio sp. LC3010]|uniref:SH3 domain-containing protein n=1 Tax=Butyrivibrio sp. LC3010 TaxID=1280680 RepID=UPI000400E3B9|nr:SH3 domain-containing protein [Butyrivibrio sp. LC3010]